MPSSNQTMKFQVNPESFADSARALVVEGLHEGRRFSVHLGFEGDAGDTATWFRGNRSDPELITGVLSTGWHVELTREILRDRTLTLNVAELRPAEGY